MKKHLYSILFTICISILAACAYSPSNTLSASHHINFSKRLTTLKVNHTFKYHVKGISSLQHVRYSTTNTKLAHISPKNGTLKSIKTGTVTVIAKIYTHNNKLVHTIRDKVKIITSTNSLNNTLYSTISFKAPKCINTFDYTISLTCNKILLKNDVKDSSLSLKHNTKTLYASFQSLSSDGRTITYTLNDTSIKSISPGDGSMNGSYTIHCSLCNQTSTLDYKERLLGQSVTGFILTADGTPISGASITLSNHNIKIGVYSDLYGFYNIRFPKNDNVDLTVSKSGYYSRCISNLSLRTTKSLCQNIVIHNAATKSLYANFEITDANSNPLPNTHINICESASPNYKSDTSHSSSNLDSAYNYQTDSTGKLLISNSSTIPSTGTACDIAHISSASKYLDYSTSYTFASITPQHFEFKRDVTYTISVMHPISSTDTVNNYEPLSFSFCFNDIISSSITFNISLQQTTKPSITNNSLTLKWDSDDLASHVKYLMLDIMCPDSDTPIKSIKSFPDNISELSSYSYNSTSSNLSSGYNLRDVLNSSSLYLPSSTYILRIRDFDSDNSQISAYSLTDFTVSNGELHFSSDTISLHQPQSVRVLAYSNMDISSLDHPKVQALLCQKLNSSAIPLAYVSSDIFTSKQVGGTAYSSASLIVPYISKAYEYILYPLNSSVEFSQPLSIHISSISDNSIWDIPDYKLLCDSSYVINNSSMISILLQQNIQLSTNDCDYNTATDATVITFDTLSISSTYPTTVICTYNLLKDCRIEQIIMTTSTLSSYTENLNFPSYIIVSYPNNQYFSVPSLDT